MSQTKNNPIAVLISDIHFNINNLELASQSLLKAQFKAKMLDVPLIIAGDLLDTKAIIRAECANKLLQMLSVKDKTPTYILVGNHDLVNEKGSEHALNFLWGFAEIVDRPTKIALGSNCAMLVPYYSDTNKLKFLLEDEDIPRTLIMHQGVLGANMGHYVQDKSSLPKETFKDFRVISGHYHRAQDIKCGRPRKGAVGLFSYIGSPYTTSFSEANDGPKGFRILYEDGSLELIPTNLRKHIIVERKIVEALKPIPEYTPGDLVWYKLYGPYVALQECSKEYIGKKLFGHSNFKFDKISDDSPVCTQEHSTPQDSSTILDNLIDLTGENDQTKAYLKSLWREIL